MALVCEDRLHLPVAVSLLMLLFRRYKKSKSYHHYSVFSYYRRLVKTAFKTDRIRLLNSIDDSLKTERKDFRKCVSKFG
jgi:hypothetical protein